MLENEWSCWGGIIGIVWKYKTPLDLVLPGYETVTTLLRDAMNREQEKEKRVGE